tara:strand:+ start:45 stop:398 length:354 start_codon:yes stop_codon:yes gene_type:complete
MATATKTGKKASEWQADVDKLEGEKKALENELAKLKEKDSGKTDLVFLGGLWVNEDANGQKYMTGSLGIGGKLFIFRRKGELGPNDSQYNMYLGEKQQRQQNNGVDFLDDDADEIVE